MQKEASNRGLLFQLRSFIKAFEKESPVVQIQIDFAKTVAQTFFGLP